MANIRRRRGTPARRNSIIAAPRSLRAGIGGKVLLVGFRSGFSRERLDGCRLAARHRLYDRVELVPKLVAEDVDDADSRDRHERHDDDVLREALPLAVLPESFSHLSPPPAVNLDGERSKGRTRGLLVDRVPESCVGSEGYREGAI